MSDMLGPDDDIDQLLGAEVFLGVDGHTQPDGHLRVSAVAMNRQRHYVVAQFGGTEGLVAWLQRPRHRQHLTLLAVGVDLTRSGRLIALDLESAGYSVAAAYELADMATGYCVYGGHDPGKPCGTQDANLRFTNNHFMRTPELGRSTPAALSTAR
jgi:hypothetical protein